jgi:8-oxo-dGTP pyrophosphatase MutT (NUDIX family)
LLLYDTWDFLENRGFPLPFGMKDRFLPYNIFHIRGLGIPGGAIAAGETPQIAAIREMK